VDHFSKIMIDDECEPPIFECFPNIQLYRAQLKQWYADIVNYLVTREMPRERTKDNSAYLLALVRYFIWGDSYLFKHCRDHIITRCMPKDQIYSVHSFPRDHAREGHFNGKKTTEKFL